MLFLSFSFLQVQSTGIFQPANCWTTQRFKRKRLGSLFHAPTLAWAVKVHLLQQMQHTKSLAKLYKRPQCSLQWGQDQDLHEFYLLSPWCNIGEASCALLASAPKIAKFFHRKKMKTTWLNSFHFTCIHFWLLLHTSANNPNHLSFQSAQELWLIILSHCSAHFGKSREVSPQRGWFEKVMLEETHPRPVCQIIWLRD